MSARFWDAKRLNHLLFGAWYEEDIYDRLCASFPRLAFLLKRCIPQAMRAKSLVFVHVPRVAGTPTCRLSDVFVDQTRHIRTVDDYLDFLEGRDPLELDFVMRPQSWFVCDLKTGAPLVDDLFLYGEDDEALSRYLEPHGITGLPWLNRGLRLPLALSPAQRARIRALYAADFALLDSVRRNRRLDPCAAVIAAE